ncbi:MAG TPA: hypothetical protein VM425_15715 [Myxococcota bacterium]|nr:hypothetical protein [Myxococcota bacterium]
MKVIGVFAFCLLFFTGCGSLDPGETTLSRWRTVPSPVTFARKIHPALINSCATSGCHARAGSLTLHLTEVSLPSDSDMTDPYDLPQPLKEDYFLVMAFCDLDLVLSSPLLVWSDGRQQAHPGGQALEADARSEIVDWLEGT